MASTSCRNSIVSRGLKKSVERGQALIARCASREAAAALDKELQRVRERSYRAGLKAWKTVQEEEQ